MKRLCFASATLACALGGTASAQPATMPTPPTAPTAGLTTTVTTTVTTTMAAPAILPTIGASFALTAQAGFPAKVDYLYDSPAAADANGKVIVHWFCSTKPKATGVACAADLARMIALKEANPRVYIIAYIDGKKADAKKLDPIRESEGVGRGTVAFGKNVTAFMKKNKVTSSTSVVVDVDGKVAMVTTAGSDLDARDQKVAALAARIKEYDFSSDGPKLAKPGEKFKLTVNVKLAPWLKYTTKAAPGFKITVPSDIKCDATTLTGDQIKTSGDTLTAQVTCSGPRGNYEARGELTFGYEGPSGNSTGLGQQSANWKFDIRP